MKKAVSLLLALMALCLGGALAQEESPLAVGTVTELTGCFYTDLWGGSLTDADVRSLIHGYGTVSRADDGSLRPDPTAVVAYQEERLANGDHVHTFTLSPYLLWSDGLQITARDYAFTVLMQSSGQLAGLGVDATRYAPLAGYQAFNADSAQPFAGVRVLDDLTFSLTVSAAALPRYEELALVMAEPTPMRVVAPGVELMDDGAGAYLSEGFTAELLSQTLMSPTGYVQAPFVTCGAFALDGYDAATHTASLKRNALYLGNGRGQVARVQSLTIKSVTNAAMMDELQSGAVDVLVRVTDGQAIKRGLQYAAENSATVLSYARSGLAYLGFADGDMTTGQLSVRQALAMSIDADRLCQVTLCGYAQPVFGLYGLGQRMVASAGERLNELDVYGYDPIGAKSLLINDGWVYDQSGQPFDEGVDELRYKMQDGRMIPFELRWAMVSESAVAEEMQQQLTKAAQTLGFRLVVTPTSFTDALRQYRGQTEAASNLFLLATNFGASFQPDAQANAGDEELIRLCAELDGAAGWEDYMERWLGYQRRWVQVLPLIPLYSNNYYDFARAGVAGYEAADGWTTAVLGARK